MFDQDFALSLYILVKLRVFNFNNHFQPWADLQGWLYLVRNVKKNKILFWSVAQKQTLKVVVYWYSDLKKLDFPWNFWVQVDWRPAQLKPYSVNKRVRSNTLCLLNPWVPGATNWRNSAFQKWSRETERSQNVVDCLKISSVYSKIDINNFSSNY